MKLGFNEMTASKSGHALADLDNTFDGDSNGIVDVQPSSDDGYNEGERHTQRAKCRAPIPPSEDRDDRDQLASC